MNTSPIIALDFATADRALQFLRPFQQQLNVKVGMQLYYQEGPEIIKQIQARGHQIFLDLKLHDIPNTVMCAMEVLAKLHVQLVNVHAAGGQEMMEAALEGLDKGTPMGKQRPSLIAVTQLTSTNETQVQEEQLISVTLETSVLHYAKLAQTAQLDGVVCSVHEAKAIAALCGRDFLKVTPGIRLPNDDVQDQKRIATPEQAKRAGATHIVVGRAITSATDPIAAYAEIDARWKGKRS